tara:strand:- start:75 stop:299 length:225 start_codon:yes stop_codon:yes gene_type:complete
MNCVICGSSRISIYVADLFKPPEERRYKYDGPCCSMGCAIKYSDMRIANTPEDKITEIKVKGGNGTYILKRVKG